MPRKKSTASETIVSILKRGPRKGLTVFAIADRGGLNLNTARTTVGTLVVSGEVELIGRETPTFGRPANVYRLADAA